MADYNQPTQSGSFHRPSIENPAAYYQQPQTPDLQQWDQQWQERANHPNGPRRPSLFQRLLKFALLLGSIFLAFALTGAIAFMLFGQSMLEEWYLEQEPYTQEVWCNRFETYLRTSYLCDLRDDAARPENPFLPTLEPREGDRDSNELAQTPLFDIPAGDEGTSGESDDVGIAPTATEEITPVSQDLATATATLAPTVTLVPTATPRPTLAAPPANASLELNRLRPELQGWNNCGPTTVTMGLSYYGYSETQYLAASFLKPDREDKNVSPWQMARFVNEQASGTTARALVRVGGDLDVLKRLLAAGFPVIIEKGYEPEGYDWMGHYLLLVGYDDLQGVFYTFDSFLGSNNGQGRRETYEYTSTYWRHFNNTFLIIYESAQEDFLMQVLGDYADETNAIQIALSRAQQEVANNPNDNWAQFNLGDAYTRLGMYEEAAAAFDIAFRLQMPWRVLWYLFTPFETFYALGEYQQVLTLAANLDAYSQEYVEEAWYYRGLVYAARGQSSQAITEFQRVLNFNRYFTPASEAMAQVQNGTFSAPAS